MPVQQVTATTRIDPDNVYVIPPNANLETIDTHLRLSKLEQEPRSRGTIDHFFRTLAETHDGDAVGIVLTGTGSDGTLGLRRIKEAGGLTIVQDPQQAEHDGMPRSAIASGMVDLVLPLQDIPGAVIRFARVRPQVTMPEEGEALDRDESRVLQKIYAQIRARTGHDFSQYKRSTILRRIHRRMHIRHAGTLLDYLDLLRSDRDEVKALFDDLLITVTEFFRDRAVFEHMEQTVLPSLFEGKTAEDQIRVWSVGCSTGEEAYSLAMLLLEQASRRDVHPQLQVFASDLHASSLGAARDGIYPAEIAENVSPERLRRFFVPENGHFRVRHEVRELVVFAEHNLLRDPPFSRMDLIVCRNLLIYLQRDVQHEVIHALHYALNPDGLLVLGASESIDQVELFRSESKEACVYRRLSTPAGASRLARFSFVPAVIRSRSAEREGTGEPGEAPASYGGLHARMVERYAPPSILVNERSEVVHASARAGRYLELPGGEPTRNLLKLVREPLRVELRSTMHAARESGRGRSRAVPVELDGQPRRITLRVQLASDPDLADYLLVIFDEDDAFQSVPGGAEEDIASSATVRELEQELTLNRQRLQALIEEYESSREEMQASNEELQSANEELRSTMEALETSKEELQSMNEELTTLNQENRHRVEELGQLSADLQNLLSSTEIATLFLDRELRIVRFTPQVAELFNVRHMDRGRPLSDLTHRLGSAALADDAREVLARLLPVEREVRSEAGQWYLTRLNPYRGRDDRTEGVVITLIDITQRKQAELEFAELKEYAEKIVETLHEPLVVLHPDLTIKSCNPAFYEHFEVNVETTIGRRIYDLGNGQWNIPALRTLLEDVLPDSNVFNDYEVDHTFESIGRRVMLLNARRLDHVQLILLGIRDITQRKAVEEELRNLTGELEARIEERVRLIGTLLKISKLANQAESPEAVLLEALKLIGEQNAWVVGHVWLKRRFVPGGHFEGREEKEEEVLEDGGIWWTEEPKKYDEFIRASDGMQPGRVMESSGGCSKRERRCSFPI